MAVYDTARESTTELALLLIHADPFGEDAVIRDVARRAGLLWACPCGDDNDRRAAVCECGRARPQGVTR